MLTEIKLKQIAALAALAAMSGALLLTTGCAEEERHSVKEKYYLVATNIKLPYWQAAAMGFNRAASQMGIKSYSVVGPDTYDPKGQVDAFYNVLGQEPAGILVSPADPNLMKPAIDAAIAKGVPVITLDSDAPTSKRLTFIGTNNYQAGIMAGRVAAKELGGKGNVVMFTMPEQLNLAERLNGYEEVFRDHPGIKIVEQVNVKGDPRIAFDKTQELIEKNANVDAFICLEASACPEVAEILSRKNVKGKVVVAFDTDDLTIEGIQKGLINATVAQKPYTMDSYGLKMLEELYRNKMPSLDGRWIENPFSPLPAFVDTGATLIDKNNVEDFLRLKQQASSAPGRQGS